MADNRQSRVNPTQYAFATDDYVRVSSDDELETALGRLKAIPNYWKDPVARVRVRNAISRIYDAQAVRKTARMQPSPLEAKAFASESAGPSISQARDYSDLPVEIEEEDLSETVGTDEFGRILSRQVNGYRPRVEMLPEARQAVARASVSSGSSLALPEAPTGASPVCAVAKVPVDTVTAEGRLADLQIEIEEEDDSETVYIGPPAQSSFRGPTSTGSQDSAPQVRRVPIGFRPITSNTAASTVARPSPEMSSGRGIDRPCQRCTSQIEEDNRTSYCLRCWS